MYGDLTLRQQAIADILKPLPYTFVKLYKNEDGSPMTPNNFIDDVIIVANNIKECLNLFEGE